MSAIDLFGDTRAARRGVSSHERSLDGGDQWLTPPEIVSALGSFDLDPCAPIVRPYSTAARHYTIEDNGLRQPWAGRVWLNPPYANAGAWMRRMSEHGNGVALLFARTETRVWQDWIWPHASAFLFMRGRVTFHLSNGVPAKSPAGAPSVFIAYGAANVRALRDSGIPGHIIENKARS